MSTRLLTSLGVTVAFAAVATCCLASDMTVMGHGREISFETAEPNFGDGDIRVMYFTTYDDDLEAFPQNDSDGTSMYFSGEFKKLGLFYVADYLTINYTRSWYEDWGMLSLNLGTYDSNGNGSHDLVEKPLAYTRLISGTLASKYGDSDTIKGSAQRSANQNRGSYSVTLSDNVTMSGDFYVFDVAGSVHYDSAQTTADWSVHITSKDTALYIGTGPYTIRSDNEVLFGAFPIKRDDGMTISVPETVFTRTGDVYSGVFVLGDGQPDTQLRRSLHLDDDETIAPGSAWTDLRPADRSRLKRLQRTFADAHNPFIRHIVRRTRKYLESALDPETSEPYLKPVRVRLFGETERDAVRLPPYLRDAYDRAEEFCQLLGARMKGAGFLKTLLLRRVGSTIAAGMNTAQKMLTGWEDIDAEDDESIDQNDSLSRTLTPAERDQLEMFMKTLEANQERDPKYSVVKTFLIEKGWLDLGCIIFSQYFDSVWWLAEQLTNDLPGEPIAVYAGGQKSGVMLDGNFRGTPREELKRRVRSGEIRLVLGTDAASEGLNLQRLGTLINLDLPWNPTRLEQRKGRIQRIGQLRDTVLVFNMRYKDSVEDRVHQLLSSRLESIHGLFGQIPDILDDVWIQVALGQVEKAQQTIDAVPDKHPFEVKYHKITSLDWERCSEVLDATDRHRHLSQGW